MIKTRLILIGILILLTAACNPQQPAETASVNSVPVAVAQEAEQLQPLSTPSTTFGEVGVLSDPSAFIIVEASGELDAGQLNIPTDWISYSIGQTVQGREILVYEFGVGNTNILMVCNVHGNEQTVGICTNTMNKISADSSLLADTQRVFVIPALNVDGTVLFLAEEANGNFSQAARTNAKGIDINRNWGGTFVKTDTSGPSEFSEPESQALRDFALSIKPTVTLIYHAFDPGIIIAGGTGQNNSADANATATKSTLLANKMHEGMSEYRVHVRSADKVLNGSIDYWFIDNLMPVLTFEIILKDGDEPYKGNPDIEAHWNGFNVILAETK